MRVKKAEYVKDYKIQLVFSNGAVKVVDFKPFLNKCSRNPSPLGEGQVSFLYLIFIFFLFFLSFYSQ